MASFWPGRNMLFRMILVLVLVVSSVPMTSSEQGPVRPVAGSSRDAAGSWDCASMPILGVVSGTGEGIVGQAVLCIGDGSGAIEITPRPADGAQADALLRTIGMAGELAGKDMMAKDVRLDFSFGGSSTISGRSGELPVGLLAYSVLSGKPIPEGMSATGKVEADGSLGAVEGMLSKAQAASRSDISMVIAPAGDEFEEVFVPMPDGFGGLSVGSPSFMMKRLNVTEYASAREGVRIARFGSLDDAAMAVFQTIN